MRLSFWYSITYKYLCMFEYAFNFVALSSLCFSLLDDDNIYLWGTGTASSFVQFYIRSRNSEEPVTTQLSQLWLS